MISLGITEIQTKPSLIKKLDLGKIVDKRADKVLGYFISSKFDDLITPIIKQIEKEEKIKKLKILKHYQDLEFAEIGIDDGL